MKNQEKELETDSAEHGGSHKKKIEKKEELQNLETAATEKKVLWSSLPQALETRNTSWNCKSANCWYLALESCSNPSLKKIARFQAIWNQVWQNRHEPWMNLSIFTFGAGKAFAHLSFGTGGDRRQEVFLKEKQTGISDVKTSLEARAAHQPTRKGQRATQGVTVPFCSVCVALTWDCGKTTETLHDQNKLSPVRKHTNFICFTMQIYPNLTQQLSCFVGTNNNWCTASIEEGKARFRTWPMFIENRNESPLPPKKSLHGSDRLPMILCCCMRLADWTERGYMYFKWDFSRPSKLLKDTQQCVSHFFHHTKVRMMFLQKSHVKKTVDLSHAGDMLACLIDFAK